MTKRRGQVWVSDATTEVGGWDPIQVGKPKKYSSLACPYNRVFGLGRLSLTNVPKLSEPNPSVLGRGEDQDLSVGLSKEKPNPLQHYIY